MHESRLMPGHYKNFPFGVPQIPSNKLSLVEQVVPERKALHFVPRDQIINFNPPGGNTKYTLKCYKTGMLSISLFIEKKRKLKKENDKDNINVYRM